MVWIPPGALVAGSAPDSFPRRADRELAGEQVILKAFYIDIFPYPNEEGAIPLTNATQPEAKKLCERLGKRLCTELEWERACKGPDNRIYAFGDSYRADVCGTGSRFLPHPAGIQVGCRSDFGVYDLHGGPAEWTDSPWHRGAPSDRVAVRGGTGLVGELVARCANGEPRPPSTRAPDLGFRCCAGPRNTAEVVLTLAAGEAITRIERPDPSLLARILDRLPAEARRDLGTASPSVLRAWIWRPVANERLEGLSVCGPQPTPTRCGLLLARDTQGRLEVTAWANTGFSTSALHIDEDARDLWLLGQDALGPFKRLVRYAWGQLVVGSKERRLGRPRRKR